MCEGCSKIQIYSPKSDLVKASRDRDHNEFLTTPSYNITSIDERRMKEVDDFYQAVQKHRKQYKDHTGRLHPLDLFKGDE
ncbi:protein FAM166C-like [Belonocnema kinseyi]|uniref:protein FAM166C-like n=1 Tax=Belonocnema kinseyi TaxID=2817044 RepID=UPI00143DF332|nr:protein FAM166C-like [Belonocnema kinseyi]